MKIINLTGSVLNISTVTPSLNLLNNTITDNIKFSPALIDAILPLISNFGSKIKLGFTDEERLEFSSVITEIPDDSIISEGGGGGGGGGSIEDRIADIFENNPYLNNHYFIEFNNKVIAEGSAEFTEFKNYLYGARATSDDVIIPFSESQLCAVVSNIFTNASSPSDITLESVVGLPLVVRCTESGALYLCKVTETSGTYRISIEASEPTNVLFLDDDFYNYLKSNNQLASNILYLTKVTR